MNAVARSLTSSLMAAGLTACSDTGHPTAVAVGRPQLDVGSGVGAATFVAHLRALPGTGSLAWGEFQFRVLPSDPINPTDPIIPVDPMRRCAPFAASSPPTGQTGLVVCGVIHNQAGESFGPGTLLAFTNEGVKTIATLGAGSLPTDPMRCRSYLLGGAIPVDPIHIAGCLSTRARFPYGSRRSRDSPADRAA